MVSGGLTQSAALAVIEHDVAVALSWATVVLIASTWALCAFVLCLAISDLRRRWAQQRELEAQLRALAPAYSAAAEAERILASAQPRRQPDQPSEPAPEVQAMRSEVEQLWRIIDESDPQHGGRER